MNKRGQFFLMGAIIISAIVLSLAAESNKVLVNPPSPDFERFGFEIIHESNSVIDYEIYKDIPADTNLEGFVSDLAKDIRDKNPEANFIFIYSEGGNVKLKNYGVASVKLSSCDNCKIPGAGFPIKSKLTLGGTSQELIGSYDGYSNLWSVGFNLSPSQDKFEIEINGVSQEIKIRDNRQVVFIMQKEVGDESFVTVK